MAVADIAPWTNVRHPASWLRSALRSLGVGRAILRLRKAAVDTASSVVHCRLLRRLRWDWQWTHFDGLADFASREHSALEVERDRLFALYAKIPSLRAPILRRLVVIEAELQRPFHSGAYSVRLVQRLGCDPFDYLPALMNGLEKQGLRGHARAIAQIVRQRRYCPSEDAVAQAENYLLQSPTGAKPEIGAEVILDSRSKTQYKVSVIWSLYEEEDRIEATFKAYLRQSLYQEGEAEYIFVDSASPTRERDILSSLAKDAPHIVYLRSNARETLYQAWNRGVGQSRGIYLCFAAPCEFLYDDALMEMAGQLDDHPEYDWVQAQLGKEKLGSLTNRHQDSGSAYIDASGCFCPQVVLVSECHLTMLTSLVRKASLATAGRFSDYLTMAGDGDFKKRFIQKSKALQIGLFGGFTVETRNARMTVHPLVEIEYFIVNTNWRTPASAFEIYKTSTGKFNFDRAMEQMIHVCCGWPDAFVGKGRRVRDLLFARDCASAVLSRRTEGQTRQLQYALLLAMVAAVQLTERLACDKLDADDGRKLRRQAIAMLHNIAMNCEDSLRKDPFFKGLDLTAEAFRPLGMYDLYR